jgi:hypothetical protein
MLPFKRGGGEKERESKNKQTYLLCFLKKEEDRDRVKINRLTFFKGRRWRESRRRRSERDASSPLCKGLETDYPCDLQDP